ncbi:hypothetical protein QJS04_geneDACA016268 [Acorus gramineus]|uniref:Alcohol dehydrogenase-like N-terminal domain-containing protein n=1 Tax=Acorus gramineus TaxID=55184 RepID=A0AAV9AHP9_ACOGR|nr:hypothetical protein QJS04_geneDACA016268 [Acorus gramineus]
MASTTGPVNGVRYFDASTPRSGSLIRPRSLCGGVSVYETVERRYRGDYTKEEEALLCRSIGDSTVPIADPSSPLTISLSHPVPILQSPTSVRVRVRATSLNDANYLQILRKYQEKPPPPFVPGSDYSGVVNSISRF